MSIDNPCLNSCVVAAGCDVLHIPSFHLPVVFLWGNTAFVQVHPRNGSTLVTATASCGALFCMKRGLLGQTPDIRGEEGVGDPLLPCAELAGHEDLSPPPSRETLSL